MNKFIPATNPVPLSDGIPFTTYEFTCIDDQGNGNVLQFDMTMISWTSDPEDPQFSLSYVLSTLETPIQYIWRHDQEALIYEIYEATNGGLIDVKYNIDELSVIGADGQTQSYGEHTFRVVQITE